MKVAGFFGKFFHLFRWYLVLLALAGHLAMAAVIIAVLAYGPDRSVQLAKDAARKLKFLVEQEVERREQKRLSQLMGKPSPDVFRFRALPDARSATLGYGRVLRVGPGKDFDRPSQAAHAARDGDMIDIAGGDYPGDTAIWSADDLLIRGVGGVVRLDAEGTQLPHHKAIWIVTGDNVRIENIAFSNARSLDKNGAGIRAEGKRLQIVSCYFHDNESGVMTTNRRDAVLRIESSEFARNGHSSGQAHQIYVGSIDVFELGGTYIHETHVGSAVKSRARKNVITANRVVDEGRGRSNYTIDLSNGGEAYIVGNILQQGPATENYTLVTFAPEGLRWERNEMFVVHNTFVNDRKGGNFVFNHSKANGYLLNNLFVGEGSPIEGPAFLIGNLVDHGKGLFGGFDDSLGGLPGSGRNRYAKDVGFMDRSGYDYSLTSRSPAIDAAESLSQDVSSVVGPLLEYRHPLQAVPRRIVGAPDVGACEFQP